MPKMRYFYGKVVKIAQCWWIGP